MIGELPLLRDDAIAIGGFENIVHHLRKRSNGQWDLDRHFTNQKDRADITAYLTYYFLNHPRTLS